MNVEVRDPLVEYKIVVASPPPAVNQSPILEKVVESFGRCAVSQSVSSGSLFVGDTIHGTLEVTAWDAMEIKGVDIALDRSES